MARSYRDVETADIPIDTAMKTAAEAALALLQSEAGDGCAGDHEGCRIWRLERPAASGIRLQLSCTGPTLPSCIPSTVIRPADIAKDRPYVGTWRLVVKAPILVLDLSWRDDKPLRVMTFANGDWQQDLAQLAGREAERT